MTSRTAAAALSVVLAAAPAAPAAAKSWPVGNDQVHIVYRNLDTRTPAGRAALLARVERAAERLCDGLVAADRRPCVADTIASAAGAGAAGGKVAGGMAAGGARTSLAVALAERRDAVRFAAR